MDQYNLRDIYHQATSIDRFEIFDPPAFTGGVLFFLGGLATLCIFDNSSLQIAGGLAMGLGTEMCHRATSRKLNGFDY